MVKSCLRIKWSLQVYVAPWLCTLSTSHMSVTQYSPSHTNTEKSGDWRGSWVSKVLATEAQGPEF